MPSITDLGLASSVAAGDQLVINQGGTDRRVTADNFARVAAANNFSVPQVAASYGSNDILVANAAAYSFTPARPQGMILLFNRYPYNSANALIAYSVTDAYYATVLVQPSTLIETKIVALNGTTGTSGKITVAAVSDGKIYIENRGGSVWYCGWAMIG